MRAVAAASYLTQWVPSMGQGRRAAAAAAAATPACRLTVRTSTAGATASGCAQHIYGIIY